MGMNGMASEAQKRYLRRRYAQERENETCCDCPGCDKCKGFVRNCTCDHDTEWLRIRHGKQEDREGMADLGESESLPGRTIPGHVDPKAYQTFGF